MAILILWEKQCFSQTKTKGKNKPVNSINPQYLKKVFTPFPPHSTK